MPTTNRGDEDQCHLSCFPSRAVRDVRRRHDPAGQHGRARLRRRVPGRHAGRRHGDQGHHRRLPRRPVPDPGRHHLPVRAGAEQRHHRLAGPARGARRARPDRGDPMDHVRHRRGAHRRRRGEPGCGRDHRPDRAGLRRPVRDQPAAHGAAGDPRRPGRRLLADQHLWRHHQRRRRQGRAAAERARHLQGQLRRQLRRGAAAVLRARRAQAAGAARRRRRPVARGAACRHRWAADRDAGLRRRRVRGAERGDRDGDRAEGAPGRPRRRPPAR